MTGTDFEQPISPSAMTHENHHAPVGTTLEQAQEILRQHRIEKLPLVDNQGRLKTTIADIEKRVQYPLLLQRRQRTLCCVVLRGWCTLKRIRA